MIACPEREELAAWSFGLLLDPRTGEIAEHVGDCPGCVSTLGVIEPPADPILEQIRRPVSTDTFLEEPECFRLITKVASIEGEMGPGDGPRGSEVSLGSRLGPYVILAWIGGGGMGTVYRARHTLLDRVVALKVLPPDRLLDPQAVSRFRREMKSVGALDHPNIIQARDAGESAGTHYLVMELVEGLDLARLVARAGPLPVADSCEIIRQAAEGLDHAFRRGLVHRDLKPSNIILAHDGRVKLLDLGLALLRRNQATEDDLTGVGQVMGTAAYMAPEQATDPHTVDVRADLYSLGCTLFFLLAGKSPFDRPEKRSPIQQILAHSREPVPSIRASRPDVPEGLAAVLERLLAKSPADRLATPSDLAAALKPFCDGSRMETLTGGTDRLPTTTLGESEEPWTVASSIPETPPGPAHAAPAPEARPGPARSRRRPRLRAAVAAALIPIAAFLAFQFIVIIRDKDGKETRHAVPPGGSVTIEPEIVNPRPSVKTGTPPIEAVSPSVASVPPISPAALVQAPARLPGVIGWTIETRWLRAGAVATAYDPGGRWLALSSQEGSIRLFDASTGRLVRVLVGHEFGGRPFSHPVAWQPGGTVLASGGPGRTIRLWDAGSGRVLRVLRGHGQEVSSLAWSPDGKVLASSEEGWGNSRLWDFATGRCVEELPSSTSNGLAWSPDGQKLAYCPSTWGILIRDAADHSLKSLNGERTETVGVAWSPDGKALASANYSRNQVNIWDATTGKRLLALEGCLRASSVAWSPDGTMLAAGHDGGVKIWESGTGNLIGTLGDGTYSLLISLSWSPDGKTLAGANRNKGACVWEVKSGRLLQAHRAHESPLYMIQTPWSTDGRKFVMNAADLHAGIIGGAGLWEAASGRLLRRIPAESSGYQYAGLSPDGRLLALGAGNLFRIEEAETGRLVVKLPNTAGAVRAVTWSPDGARLALADQIWNVDTGALVLSLSGRKPGTAHALEWSPDGKLIAAGDDELLRLHDATTGAWVRNLTEHATPVTAIAWSPDGKLVASGDQGGVLSIGEASTGNPLRYRDAHNGNRIEAIRWSPDGKTIVTLGREASIAWDAESGQFIRNVVGSPSPDFRIGAETITSAAVIRLSDFRTDKPLGVIANLAVPMALAISADGHYRGSPGIEAEIVYVVETEQGQEMLTPEEFARKYEWKNDPDRVKFAP